jgi:toxin ParE1/3/4
MAQFRFRPKAIVDINSIWKYTFRTWSRTQANRYVAQIYEVCQKIADNSAIGKLRYDIDEKLYALLSGKHIIFYRVASPNEIIIVRILHGQMDLKSRIQE